MSPDEWGDQIERVAIYLYREERNWAEEPRWDELPEATRSAYVKRARSVGYMFNFPNHTNIVRQWDRLCPCDHHAETTHGPERDCPIHGEMPYAVDRLVRLAAAANPAPPVDVAILGEVQTHA